ncbi:alpha/beta hydrolase [bacterium]|nr:alpha/beta hydrolase [bacterium]
MPSVLLHVVVFLTIVFVSTASPQEIIKITSFDGEQIVGRLNMPADEYSGKIVIEVPGTGPNTYLNKRKIGRSLLFNYHDYFAEEFNRRGIAYFSYSTRYTELDTIPPNFDKVNKERFFTYTPSTKVKDLEEIIKFLKQHPRLKSSQFILLGQSEGTIIATLLVENDSVAIDALLLCGTPTDDVFSTIQWQFSGEASMINFRKFFDINGDGIIQKNEYENSDPRALKRVGNLSFAALDSNEDSLLTAEDFGTQLQPRLAAINSAIENNDNEWIWNNFFRIGTDWIDEHRNLRPNSERILNLDIPIFIFHGDDDANCPVDGILKLQETAKAMNKENIHVYTFEGHDHSLEFLGWVIHETMPEGLRKLFVTAEEL